VQPHAVDELVLVLDARQLGYGRGHAGQDTGDRRWTG
jgi:hypothetical protein